MSSLSSSLTLKSEVKTLFACKDFLGIGFPFPFEASRLEECVSAVGGVVLMSALKMKKGTVNHIVMFQRYLKKIAARQVFILSFS